MKFLLIGGLYEGIGLSTAFLLAKNGHEVIIIHAKNTSREKSKVQETEKDVIALIKKYFLRIEIFRYSDYTYLDEKLKKESSTTDGVIVCEGQRAYDFTSIIELEYLDIEVAIKKELYPIVSVSNNIFPSWINRSMGVFISFGFHEDYWDNHLPLHSGHKYGRDSHLFRIVKNLKKNLFREYSDKFLSKGIRSNIVNPGRVRNLKLKEIENHLFIDVNNLPKNATSLHVAFLVNFLISDESCFVSGAEIPLINNPLLWKNSNGKPS